MPQDVSVLALIRGREHYVYVYDDVSREELIDTLRLQAGSGQHGLSWYDAAVLAERARQQAREARMPQSPTKG